MERNPMGMGDTLTLDKGKHTRDGLSVDGTLTVEVHDADGALKSSQIVNNLITEYGDQVYMERGSGHATPNAPTGMRLGTGGSGTAASKTGAGAAIAGTYVTGSNAALGANSTTATASALNGSARRLTYQSKWLDTDLTPAKPIADIDEVVITNETGPTDVAGVAGNTISRAVITAVNLDTGDTLTVTWNHDGEGT